jgi:taurine dioxygenase
VAEQLTQALHENGVLFFSAGEPVSDEEHQQFARVFGEVLTHSVAESLYKDDSDFDTFDSAEQYPTDVWHTDGSTWACPPQASVLRCIVMPPFGGDTMWASMYAAYESLSSHYQLLLDGLEAVHTTAGVARRNPGLTLKEKPGQVQPVVLRDPVTGRRMLYVNSLYTDRIVGFSDTESERLLSMLFEHVNTPEFHVRLRWKQDTIAVWEERVTQHRAIYDYHPMPRLMKRLEIAGKPLTA